MEIRIRRFDTSLPLPEYKTEGASAMDLAVRESGVVPASKVATFGLNIAVQPPAGHFVLLAARSSLHKRGLVLANGVGILDEDYSGNEDEYKVVLHNVTDTDVQIERGERVAQMIVMPYDRVTWNEVEDLGTPNRGGFGTTGR